MHRVKTQECSMTGAYMINASGQCINLDTLEPANAVSNNIYPNNINLRRASSLMPAANQSTQFPPQSSLNTIIVDNSNDFLAAIQQLKAGDRLLVKHGIYQAPDNDEIEIRAVGSANNWIVIAAYPGEERPLLQGKNLAALGINASAYVEIRGFEVVGANPSQNPSSSGIVIGDRSHHIRVIDNTIHSTPGNAIHAENSDYINVESNVIHNVAWGWLPSNPNLSYANSGISFYQLTDANQANTTIRNIVRGNAVFNVFNSKPFLYSDTITDGNCFILDDTQHTQEFGSAVQSGFSEPYTGTTLVENNLCVDNGGRGIHAYFSDNLIARNNTLYKNSKTPGISGELSAVESRNVRFYNNILYSKTNDKAIINYNSTDIKVETNVLFGSARTDRGVGALIKADPQFVNPSIELSTADFSLRPNSPAIGVGSKENCSDRYFDGSPRNGTCDLGAFPVAR
jgi:parallel beta-helix repeat protein